MTIREQFLAIMAGQSPDAIPWIPRLDIWYEAHKRQGTLPEKYQGWSQREIERDLGMGTPARNGRVFRTELRNIEIRTQERGNDIITKYITSVGTVSTVHRRSAVLEQAGISHIMEVEHMIKEPEDYPVVEHIIQHTEVIPTYEEFLEYEKEVGEDGVPLVRIGSDPMFQILKDLVGFNNAFFHLHDYPDRVSRLLEVLTEHALEIQQVTIESPAQLISHGNHFASQMTPPYLFEKYMLPYFQPFAERLHQRGKVLACHADADTSMLLDLIMQAGFDMVESFVTAPMVPVTLQQARAAFGNKVIIWGGIPSTILCDLVNNHEFEEYMVNLFRTIAPGDAFILGVSDNIMAEAKLERIERVSEMVKEYGTYPIDTA